jgi:SAM-dependent methyltransferase
MNKSIPVLDIGVGQGRNTFFLAREGFQVDVLDPSKVAVETVSAIAEKEVFNIRSYQCCFDKFIPSVDCYSGILVFGLIQMLPWKSIELLLEKIKR